MAADHRTMFKFRLSITKGEVNPGLLIPKRRSIAFAGNAFYFPGARQSAPGAEYQTDYGEIDCQVSAVDQHVL